MTLDHNPPGASRAAAGGAAKKTRRASPLPADERRAALVDATLRALCEQRRPLNTREIAQAAGVAEGTIFRIFASKDDLIDAVIGKAFGRESDGSSMAQISLDQPLRDRLIDYVTIVQERLQNVFGLMEALGLTAPPASTCDPEADMRQWERAVTALRRVLGPDAATLRVDPAGLFRYLRLLTFSGSHPGISDGDTMTPAEIVEVVLNGVTHHGTENAVVARHAGDLASGRHQPLPADPEEPTC